MGVVEKFKNALDWFGRGQLVIQILVALGLGTGVRAILRMVTAFNPLWITPTWLLSSAVFLALAMFSWNRISKRLPAQHNTSATTLVQQSAITLTSLLGVPQQPLTFDAALFFRRGYHSPLTAEVEKNIRLIAEQNSPGDPSAFLCRFIGVGLVSYLHDVTWAYIYKSQLLLLLELNRRLVPLAESKGFYDRAAIEFPQTYINYSFQQWLTFMRTQ